ncbi:solute carrier organic anion transporter family member 74D-like isoform X2 [Chrysoperla carnea]|uniref:solute carrier organic anion transporter family member 74D-like isoform X2 n=1 Tax=Chrysoperla carnea TaxID=189513 RepID=UPI001D08E36F|nr:solute carrier organic anion transporter family member 74D-like isoform X2 [Chrysoperla carnea]
MDSAVGVACGIGCLRALWMQRFATIKSFIAVYSILGMIQSMSYIYFTITLTTLEKRFKIPGKTLGIVLSGNEVSQILLSIFLSYYGGQRNRPRWIAIGTLSSALSCFVLALPHFLYGAGEDALRLTEEYVRQTPMAKSFISELSLKKDPILHCMANKPEEDCDNNAITSDLSITPLVLIFLSQFILGIGTTLFYVLGQTYVDDNTEKTDTPKLLGVSMALRMVGPTFGFLLGFLCLRVYIDPSLTPIIKKEDPRWMGAWWIGWIICGTLMAFMALLLGMFPKQLPKPQKTSSPDDFISESETIPLKDPSENIEKPPKEKPNLKDLIKSLRRITGNKILMNNILSGVFALLGASGFITYFIKYIEIQFQRSSAKESAVAGPIILVGSFAGLMGSGLYISKYKPKPKYLLFWNVVIGMLFILTQFSFIFLGCTDHRLKNYSNISKIIELNSECNALCDCDHVKFSPVCDARNNMTYFSPCHAGCTVSTVENSLKESTIFDNIVTDGFCDSNCNAAYYTFIIIMAVSHFAMSSGRIGNMLVNYRAVDVKDKSLAQGFGLWMVSIFALIPGPIIYGYIYDSACLVWDQRCNKRGNCWYYERDRLRWTLNVTAMCFTTIAVYFDYLVWKQGKNLDLYGDLDPKPENTTQTDEKVKTEKSPTKE